MDLLKLALAPAAIIDSEGSLLYINGLAESLFTVCSDLEPKHSVWDILSPGLREPLQGFLVSNNLNCQIENSDYTIAFDRIFTSIGSSLGVSLRCSPNIDELDH